MNFQELGLHEHIITALTEAGYTAPTAVQEKSIPLALEGRDLLVSSQTGSGKTAAFMLPALTRINKESPEDALARAQVSGPRVLVLTPTRELAMQVTEACRKYGRHLRNARAVSVVGGMPYPVQNRQLSQRYEVLVATPGRLMDHMSRGRIDFSGLEMLVLDEADRMLDMGFIDDIEQILGALPKDRQTLLFSATVDTRIEGITRRLMRNPERIEIASATTGHSNIEQRILYTDSLDHKNRLLDFLLRDATLDQAIVFTATKRDAELLANDLDANGFAAAALHGDMTQGSRNRTLTGLRRGQFRVLVATDVAARGIDVQTISHVINFDLPKNPEDYVHRIGRTGRAGRFGVAISFASGRDRGQVRAIERYTNNKIAVHTVPGMEPRVEHRPEPRRDARPGRPPARSFDRTPGGGQREGQGAYPKRDSNRSFGPRGQAQGDNRGNTAGANVNGNVNGNTNGNRSFGGGAAREGDRFDRRDGNRDAQRPAPRAARDTSREAPREWSRDPAAPRRDDRAAGDAQRPTNTFRRKPAR